MRKVELPTVVGTGGGSLEIDEKQGGILTDATISGLDELEAVLKAQVVETPVTVLLDRLDDAWHGTDDSLHLIGGAVRATRDIAIAWDQPSPSPVITFLRTDLWERLSFNDKNKMSQDIIYLDWTPEQLGDVVDLRIQSPATSAAAGRLHLRPTRCASAPARRPTSRSARWAARGMSSLSRSSPGTRRSPMGMRGSRRPISTKGEKAYSKHILGELRDETEQHVSDYNAVTNSIKALGKRNFTADEWYSACKQNGLSKVDAEQAFYQLFEASAVGVHGAGGAKGGSGHPATRTGISALGTTLCCRST